MNTQSQPLHSHVLGSHLATVYTVLTKKLTLKKLVVIIGGRDSSVGIATRYGLGGSGIKSPWGTRFSATFQTGPGTHPASYTRGTGSFPGVKRSGRGADHPPPTSAEVKGRVELYLNSPLGLHGLF